MIGKLSDYLDLSCYVHMKSLVTLFVKKINFNEKIVFENTCKSFRVSAVEWSSQRPLTVYTSLRKNLR